MLPSDSRMLRRLLLVIGLGGGPAAAQDVASIGLAPPSVATRSIATTSPAPFRAAIARAGAHLAQQPTTRATSEPRPWSSVQRLKSGEEIIVTRRDALPERRVAVSVDEQTITVLNLTDPALPVEVARALRTIAAQRVDVLSRRRGRFWMNGVHVNGGEVFFRDRQVADVSQLLETLRRDELVLVELGTRTQMLPRAKLWTSLIVGAAGGGWVFCNVTQRRECTSTRPFAIGAGIGAGVGALVGRRKEGRSIVDDGVVYREPGARETSGPELKRPAAAPAATS